MGKRLDGTPEDDADVALLKDMRKADVAIPLSANFYQISTVLRSIAFRTARSIKPIRKWYQKNEQRTWM